MLPPSRRLSHLDQRGNVHMVDVGAKAPSERLARAESRVCMQPRALELVRSGETKKGNVLACARIAAIMAAKQTAQIIPLCHPLPLVCARVDFALNADSDFCGISVITECRAVGQTGVEMEALTAASVAALTIYDMCKSVDRGMIIGPTRLLKKCGGKSGTWRADD